MPAFAPARTAADARPPRWFWIVTGLLVLWEIAGCLACISQIRMGPAAWGPVDDWARGYYAALPAWYNPVYAVATFGGLAGSLALLLRRRAAQPLLWLSLAGVVAMFGYAFAATDLIAHKGAAQVVPFPVVIAVVTVGAIGLARSAERRGWMDR